MSLGCSISLCPSILTTFPLVSRGDLSCFESRLTLPPAPVQLSLSCFFSKTLTYQCSPFPVFLQPWPLPLALDVNFHLPSWLPNCFRNPLLYCQGAILNFFLNFKHRVHTSRLSFCALFLIRWFRTFFYDLVLLIFTFEVPLQSPRHRETHGMFLTTPLISHWYIGSCGLGFFRMACCQQACEPGRGSVWLSLNLAIECQAPPCPPYHAHTSSVALYASLYKSRLLLYFLFFSLSFLIFIYS